MPISPASSLVDLIGGISAATGVAVILASARRDAAPGLRSFGSAWACVALYLLIRPGTQAGQPALVILDVLSGGAAAALFLHGARAWAPKIAKRKARAGLALSAFAFSCAVQSAMVVVSGPASNAMARFRMARLLAVMALAFLFTAEARRGPRLSPRIFSWTFGALAILGVTSMTLSGIGAAGDSLVMAAAVVDSLGLLAWCLLAVSMACCLLEDRALRRATREQAVRDEVTGLTKRAPFEIQLQSMLAHRAARGEGLALVILDLDRFRMVNDSMGHEAGDAVLLEVADRLRQSLPSGALAGRVGGDEFVAVWPGVSDSAEALRLASELMAVLASPMLIKGQEVLVTATGGVSVFPTDANDAQALLDHAHAAAHRTKESAPGRPRLYHADMTGRSRREMSMEMRLRRALSLDELWVYYQPRLCVATGKIDGFEALVRWLHPGEGLLAAAAFMDLAESTGLVIPIGRFVLHRACREAQEARAETGSDFSVAVNLSAQQLADPAIVSDVRDALQESELPPEALEVEVTETAAMFDIAQARSVLERLRGLGVSVALDDFGTGHSALGYLKELPIDRLKIDKCFVRDLATDAKDRFLLRAVIALGRARGLSVTAEGVEDPRQLRFLAAAGCHHLQGYLIGTARPALDLARLAGCAPEGVSARLLRKRKPKLTLVARQA